MTRNLINNLNRTEARQLGMTNEHLAEEGKRLEVALGYVTQINEELQMDMQQFDKKMEEYEDLIEENQSLKLLLTHNDPSVEKMSETLRRDFLKLKGELRKSLASLNRLKQDKYYSVYNEKIVWRVLLD